MGVCVGHKDDESQAKLTALCTKKLLPAHIYGGSVAEWLACWTQAQKGLGSNRSRDAVE